MGPGIPSSGLADVLQHPTNKMVTAVSVVRYLKNRNPIIRSHNLSPTPLDNHSGVLQILSKVDEYTGNAANKSYRMVQCSYSNKEKLTTIVRFRSKGTNWSGDCHLDDKNLNNITIKFNNNETFKGMQNQWINAQKYSPDFYSLCSVSTVADAPFQRTRLIVVIDKTVLVNSVGTVSI